MSFNLKRLTTASGPATASNISLSIPPTAAIQRVPDRVICSVFESGKVDISIGICFINIATGEITLSNILDSQTYVRTIHKLNVFEPSEIILPQIYLDQHNKLVTILNANISPDIRIVGLERSAFNSNVGREEMVRLCFEKDKLYLSNILQNQPFVLSALSGAVQFMQKSRNQGVSFDKFRFKFQASESIMFIDLSTANSLQLVQNSFDQKGLSFFKFMNHTETKMGERSLRNNILQPLSDQESIIERLASVKELKDNSVLLDDIRFELRNCQDLDKLFALMLMSKNQSLPTHNDIHKVNHIILVKQAVMIASSVAELLKDCTSPLLKQIREICTDDGLVQVKELIDDTINEDCTWASGTLDTKNQRCYAVKSGRNGLLDVSRRVYKVVVDEIFSVVQTLADEYDLELEQGYNAARGFYVKVLDYKNIESVPDVFINRVSKKKYIECSTLDIIKCNSRLDDTVNEILTISNQILESMTDEISTFLPILFMVAEALSLLDLIQSFSYLANKQRYISPEFSNHLTLKASRHPIVETLVESFVPNDICCIDDVSRFQVITGTNMSGKSVYLKQVALLSIMAQMGSFVPADCGIFKVFESLKARICVDSLLASNGSVSTFTNEMNEMVCILEEINDKTLVIIDELGRGSSINDGYAISLAISEHLVSALATVFISTHFHKLSKVLSTKPGVIQNHMRTDVIGDRKHGSINMKYKLAYGGSESTLYGISIARNFFDNDTIERAMNISRRLEVSDKRNDANAVEQQRNKRFHNLVGVLRYVYEQHQGGISSELLLKIQNEFLS